MKSFLILLESPTGRRIPVRIGDGYELLVKADSKSTAIAWARMRGIVGKIVATEVIDAEYREAS